MNNKFLFDYIIKEQWNDFIDKANKTLGHIDRVKECTLIEEITHNMGYNFLDEDYHQIALDHYKDESLDEYKIEALNSYFKRTGMSIRIE